MSKRSTTTSGFLFTAIRAKVVRAKDAPHRRSNPSESPSRVNGQHRLPHRGILNGILIFGLLAFASAVYASGAPVPMPVSRALDNATPTSAPATATSAGAFPKALAGNPTNAMPMGGAATATSTNTPPKSRGGDSTRVSSPSTPIPRVATATPSPVATATSPPPAAAALRTGAYVPGAAQNTALLDQFEAMTGKKMAIVPWYAPWGYQNGWYTSALDTAALNAVAARGSTPFITWEAWGTINGVDPSHVANITAGNFDAYIDSWASGLKAYGRPVYLRLFHEMNFQGYPWAYGTNGNTAADLIAAWRHVHDRFARIGATNVQWVWCPNPQNNVVALKDLYPGDAYVDWLGVDVYNGGTQFDWGGWVSAQQAMAQTYAIFQALSPTKPVMIPETSSVEQGGSKAQWITDLYTSLPRAMPNVRAIVWFHENWTATDSRNLPVADWRLDTSPAALQAFRNT